MSKARKGYSYQINLIPEDEGGYTVLVPSLLWRHHRRGDPPRAQGH